MLTHNKLSVLLIVVVQIRSYQLIDHVVLLVHHIPEPLTIILYARLNNVTSMKSSYQTEIAYYVNLIKQLMKLKGNVWLFVTVQIKSTHLIDYPAFLVSHTPKHLMKIPYVQLNASVTQSFYQMEIVYNVCNTSRLIDFRGLVILSVMEQEKSIQQID